MEARARKPQSQSAEEGRNDDDLKKSSGVAMTEQQLPRPTGNYCLHSFPSHCLNVYVVPSRWWTGHTRLGFSFLSLAIKSK